MADQVAPGEGADELRAAFDRVSDGIFVLDAGWRIRFLNAAGAAMTGLEAAAVIGRSLWEQFPDALGSGFDAQYRRAMREQCVVEFEEYYPPLKGWFDIRAFPSPAGLTIYFRNVSERHRLVEERERALEALAAQNAARAQFEQVVERSRGFIAIVA